MRDELSVTIERLAAAAGLLEQAVERLGEKQTAFTENAEATISRIVATVEAQREAELEDKLATAELKIAELQARGSTHLSGPSRKTLPSAMTSLSAKQGVALESLEAGTVDAALVGLSLEQRIAVKAQLMRAGLLG